MDEADIRKLLAAGRQREAFEMIVDRYQEKAFHLALSLTRSEATARDMAQEAFLRVWKALPSYDGSASLSTWIYVITRNVCFTEIKRAGARASVSLDAPESDALAGSLTAPESAEAAGGTALDVAALLARLPENYRRAIQLFYLEEKSGEETATLLGVPLGTLKTLLFRGRKELARLAAGKGGVP